MAEVAGLAFGIVSTVGFLGQSFDGCVKAYRFFTKAKNLEKDAGGMVTKMKIEEMRLIVWGREWGISQPEPTEKGVSSGGGYSVSGFGQSDGINAPFMAVSYGSPEVNDAIRVLAIEILQKLEASITDYSTMQERYGIKVEPPEPPSSPHPAGQMLGSGKPPPSPSKPGNKSNKSSTWSSAATFGKDLKKRAQWVVKDKEKFALLLRDLKEYNDGLESLFPRSRIDTLHRTWVSELLRSASRDVSQLNLLESAAESNYPQLHNSATLKKLKINLDLQSETPTRFIASAELKIPGSALKIGKSCSRGKHTAVLQKGSPREVIVEWMSIEKSCSMEERMILYQRIDFLARMLHCASDRHPDLNTLDCVGYYDDSAHERLGLIYLVPVPSPSRGLEGGAAGNGAYITLRQILTDTETYRQPDLNARFELARRLAVGLWSLHSLDWLHKGVSSENVVFLQQPPPPPALTSSTSELIPEAKSSSRPVSRRLSSQPALSPSHTPSASMANLSLSTSTSSAVPGAQVSLDNPKILGFASARPSHPSELTTTHASSSPLADLHRHPRSLGIDREKYRKSFDVYSLGLVLLEIGLWRPLRSLYSSRYSVEEFREKVRERAVPALGVKVGAVYRGVVEGCLAQGDREEGDMGRFMEWVMGGLESLHV